MSGLDPTGWCFIEAPPGPMGVAHGLIDTGASMSAISDDLANYLAPNGRRADRIVTVPGRSQRWKTLRVRFKLIGEPGSCGWLSGLVAVGNDLIAPAGEGIDLVLGTDYLNENGVVLSFSKDKALAGVTCRRG